VALVAVCMVVQTLVWVASGTFDAAAALGISGTLAAASFAFWLTWKAPENWVSWILGVTVTGTIANHTAFNYFEEGAGLGFPAPAVGFALHHLLLWPSIALIGVLALVFPTGRPPAPKWMWVIWMAAAGAALPFPRALHLAVTVPVAELEDGPSGVPWIDLASSVGRSLIGFTISMGLVALFLRLVRSKGVERRQMLYVVPSIVLLGGFVLLEAVVPDPGWVVVELAVGAGVLLLPFSMGLAILKYRLYEIDRVVSRTVAYAVTLALLGAAYAGLVVALRGLVPVEGDLPVAVSTLVVAALFLPLVRRVQRVVDRRFFRSRYDAGVVVSRVADELRGSLDLAEVTGRVESVVDEVFVPVTVGVWVAEQTS
jgi:hypothetical protein